MARQRVCQEPRSSSDLNHILTSSLSASWYWFQASLGSELPRLQLLNCCKPVYDSAGG
jgi:hypothetical protein